MAGHGFALGGAAPGLKRRRGELLIKKKYASAFFGTDLASFLATQMVDTVIIAGCTTSGCVRATAVDALQYGLHAIVPREAVGDRAIEPHEASLFDIDMKYGDVVSLREGTGVSGAQDQITDPPRAAALPPQIVPIKVLILTSPTRFHNNCLIRKTVIDEGVTGMQTTQHEPRCRIGWVFPSNVSACASLSGDRDMPADVQPASAMLKRRPQWKVW